MRREKALALGDEPEKGPDVTQVTSPSFFSIHYLVYAKDINLRRLKSLRGMCLLKD